MKDHRDHDRPFSADSSRKVPGRLAASLRYADSGVSLSASTLRVTGTTRWPAASALSPYAEWGWVRMSPGERLRGGLRSFAPSDSRSRAREVPSMRASADWSAGPALEP